ncbi:winged helix-turn-helix transcriptional regulator [Nannocystis pusilla]|uniref:Winged helix-turn-helix transcriptional regulator n=1 Tax=Nannocystis pusilla TaxID=889268 RepID=A0A9X3EP09_9BACT|nr:winged helix-turn-helix transcriptional regulator [Nannocystis pusilla]
MPAASPGTPDAQKRTKRLANNNFTDLLRGLPRIPTHALSPRLEELEQADAVRRRLLPRPGGAIVYELTERGRALEPAVLALGPRGAPLLGEPGADEIVTADPRVTASRTTSTPRPRAASTSATRCEPASSWSTRASTTARSLRPRARSPTPTWSSRQIGPRARCWPVSWPPPMRLPAERSGSTAARRC